MAQVTPQGSEESRVLWLRDQPSLVVTRNVIRRIAKDCGLSEKDQSELDIYVTELGQNILRYAGRGQVAVRPLDRTNASGVELVFTDDGPGIDDLEEALQDGYSSHQTMGIGLGGTRRLADEFEIITRAEQGTTVTIRMWAR